MLGAAVVALLAGCTEQEQPQEKTAVEAVKPKKTTDTVALHQQQVTSGDLLLVNNVVKLQQEPAAIATWGNEALASGQVELVPHIQAPLEQMLQAAHAEGVTNFRLNSGYRNFEQQQALYDERGADYALPAGFSEHQLGLAVDIGSTEGMIQHAAEGQWLANNAAKYGFVLRYPDNKVEVTGIQFEPWHFRYVGLPHSLIMQQQDWVLEEYIDYLQKNTQYEVMINGQHYKIHYYTVMGSREIELPKDTPYTIAGDNMSGVIITMSVKSEESK